MYICPAYTYFASDKLKGVVCALLDLSIVIVSKLFERTVIGGLFAGRYLGFCFLLFVAAWFNGCGKNSSKPTADATNPPGAAANQFASASKPQSAAASATLASPKVPLFHAKPSHNWALPTEPGVSDSDLEALELTVNETGTSALVRTKRNIYSLGLADGRVIQTFRPAAKKWNKNPSTDEMYLSPNAGVVATWAEPPDKVRDAEATVTFQDAESASVLSVARLQRDVDVRFNMGIFTASSDALLLPGTRSGKPCVETLPVRSGGRKIIPLPTTEESRGLAGILLPLPNAYGFLACGGVRRVGKDLVAPVAVLDLTQGQWHSQQSIDIMTFHGIYDRRLEVSVTGQFAIAQDTGQTGLGRFQLADLWNDKQLTNVAASMASFDTACFTPDGQRFIVQWVPHFKMSYYNPAAPNLSHTDSVSCRLKLYEVSPPKLIAECEMPTYVRTMAISANGRVFAWARGTHVYTIDFKSAFGVDPLPPAAVASDSSFAQR